MTTIPANARRFALRLVPLDAVQPQYRVLTTWLFELPYAFGLVPTVLRQLCEGGEFPYESATIPERGVSQTQMFRNWCGAARDEPEKLIALSMQYLTEWLQNPREPARYGHSTVCADTLALLCTRADRAAFGRIDQSLSMMHDLFAERIPQLFEAQAAAVQYLRDDIEPLPKAAVAAAWQRQAATWRTYYRLWWLHSLRTLANVWKEAGHSGECDVFRFETWTRSLNDKDAGIGAVKGRGRYRGPQSRIALNALFIVLQNQLVRRTASQIRGPVRAALLGDMVITRGYAYPVAPSTPPAFPFLFHTQVQFASFTASLGDYLTQPDALPPQSSFQHEVSLLHARLQASAQGRLVAPIWRLPKY